MSELPIPRQEWSLVLAACSVTSPLEKLSRIKNLLEQPVDWKSLIKLADHHGVLSLLYESLRGMQSVPPETLHNLETSYQANLHKTLLLARELITIVDSLTQSGIEALPYKGLALGEMVYRDIASRPSGDLDLLIRRRDVAVAQKAISSLGYTSHAHFSEEQHTEYLKSGYELSFDGPAGPNLLELQWAFQPGFYAVDFDMDAVFQRAIPIHIAGSSMKTTHANDLLLALSVHAAKHVWERLIWICDIARLMQSPALDWEWIGAQAIKLGVSRILSLTLLLAKNLLAAPVPAAAERALPYDGQVPALCDEISRHLFSESKFNMESLSYFRLMMQLRERPRDRWRFFHRLLLTPGPGEWQAIRLTQPASPMYKLVRLTRIAARLVRA